MTSRAHVAKLFISDLEEKVMDENTVDIVEESVEKTPLEEVSSVQEESVDVIVEDEENTQEEKHGILYEYSLKLAEKQAKIAKRQGVMQFIKYALCAASAGIIQIVLFTILDSVIKSDKTIHFIVEDMTLGTFIATTVALCASILWNFTFNRKFTFKDASNVPKAMILAFLFYVPFYPFQTWYVYTIKELLIPHIGSWAGIIAEATVMIINFALEFMWQKFVVFRKPKTKKAAVGVGAAIEDVAATDQNAGENASENADTAQEENK